MGMYINLGSFFADGLDLGLTVLHCGLAFSCFMHVYGVGMGPTSQVTTFTQVILVVTWVLLQPMISAWTPGANRHLPPILEWIFLLATNLLWGLRGSWLLLEIGRKPKADRKKLYLTDHLVGITPFSILTF